jgi:hypothetical protein
LPVFRFNKAFKLARGLKVFLKLEGGVARYAAPDARRPQDGAENLKNTQRRTSEYREKLKSKKQELRQIKDLPVAREPTELAERTKREKRTEQEIFQLRNDRRAAREGAAGEPTTGALPDFVIVGGKKCGTTFLYDYLLTEHSHVEYAAAKELHYFDVLFDDESIEWYRRCFLRPRWKDGRKTITGEATPNYLVYPKVPERMAKVIPQARLIALLRNPVDRAYSDYHGVVGHERETRTFEEAIGFDRVSLDARCEYLSKGVYVDHLLRWSRFFNEEQMLVLKSEDLYERTQDTLQLVLDFLDLPNWQPGPTGNSSRRNKGAYVQRMDPGTRRRLEDYFEPHNQRLYEYLGVDFGW